jgi:hypothetical protein
MLLNAYLICLRFTRGSTIKRTVQVRRSVSEDFSEGSIPKDNAVRGRNPGWKDTFSIDDKGGEIYHMQSTEAWFQGERWSYGELQ